jgi:hypothetical protein
MQIVMVVNQLLGWRSVFPEMSLSQNALLGHLISRPEVDVLRSIPLRRMSVQVRYTLLSLTNG